MKILFITLLTFSGVAFATNCIVTYSSYELNGKTVQCECITCNNITECTCR